MRQHIWILKWFIERKNEQKKCNAVKIASDKQADRFRIYWSAPNIFVDSLDVDANKIENNKNEVSNEVGQVTRPQSTGNWTPWKHKNIRNVFPKP